MQKVFLIMGNFFKKMTYDVVSYEFCLREIFPNAGALEGGGAGPIQNRSDFDSYPWDELPKMFWAQAGPRLDALAKNLPAGMKAVGGVGNGVFELVEDLVGLEYLPLAWTIRNCIRMFFAMSET